MAVINATKEENEFKNCFAEKCLNLTTNFLLKFNLFKMIQQVE